MAVIAYSEKSAVVVVVAALLMSACDGPKAGQFVGTIESAGPDFDCDVGFDTLLETILARPAVKDWGMDRDTARYIQDDMRRSLYVVTGKKHPAHPAIIERRSDMSINGAILTTQACAYGDRQALDADLRAYALLDRALEEELVILHYETDSVGSPTLRHLTPPPPPPPAR